MGKGEDELVGNLTQSYELEMSHAHDVIVANAKRLLDDARLLYEHERFQSCTALAVLAIEECGKAQIIRSVNTDDNIQYKLRKHVLKQQHAMRLYQAGTVYKALMRLILDILSTISPELKDRILLAVSNGIGNKATLSDLLSDMGVGPETMTNAFETTFSLSSTEDPFSLTLEFLKKIRQSSFPENTLKQYLLELMRSLQIMCSDMESYFNESMNLHKHSALYVDVSESAAETSISSAVAERYIRIADQTIKLLRSSAFPDIAAKGAECA